MSDKDEFIASKKFKYRRNKFETKSFLDENIIISGPSKTGKSYLLNDILRSLASSLNLLMIFSGTAAIDPAFPMHKYTHPAFIHNKLDLPKLIQIVDTAERHMEEYRKTQDLDIISPIAEYLYLETKKFRCEESQAIKKLAMRINTIKKEFNKLKDPVKNVTDQYKSQLVELYVKVILLQKRIIEAKQLPIKDEMVKLILRYIDYNPHICIVLNDLTDEYEALSKKDKVVFGVIFNRGRHACITMIMLIHNWTAIQPTTRATVRNIIFTSNEMITSFIGYQKMQGTEASKFRDAGESIIIKDRDQADKFKIKFSCPFFRKDINCFEYLQADPKGIQVYVGTSIEKKRKVKSRK